MLYDLQRYVFLSKLLANECINKRSVIDRSDYGDYVSLQIKYDFKDTDSIGNIKSKVWKAFYNSLPDL